MFGQHRKAGVSRPKRMRDYRDPRGIPTTRASPGDARLIPATWHHRTTLASSPGVGPLRQAGPCFGVTASVKMTSLVQMMASEPKLVGREIDSSLHPLP
jgi:hypothetical protein